MTWGWIDDAMTAQGNVSFDIKDKTIIVTGANRGNGLAMASAIAAAGANLVRVDISFDTSLQGDDRVFDLTDACGIDGLVDAILADHGRVDGLVNNAGVSLASADPYSDFDVYDRTMAINATAAFRMCARLCPAMAKAGGGSIVNITSLGAELGFPGNPSYQMSKAALRQLSRAIARDWGSQGVRANNIGPGYIHTAMTDKSFNDPQLHEDRRQRILLKRWGEPEDLAGPVIFLLSDASRYITGSDIWVDGGWTANGL